MNDNHKKLRKLLIFGLACLIGWKLGKYIGLGIVLVWYLL